MTKILIKPKNHTNKDNDDFVGMKFLTEDEKPVIEASFPMGYDFLSNVENKNDLENDNVQKQLKEELYFLLKTIRRHSNTQFDSLFGQNFNEDGFPFDAYITILEMYMQFGYYIENEITYQKSSRGKINWKRTISQVKPMLQNNSPVYLDFVVRKDQKHIDNIITLIHQWCVYEAFSKFGFLFTHAKSRKPILEINEDNKTYYLTILQQALTETFNDKNKLLFSSMIAMLKLNKSKSKQPFFFGTTKFQHVWENVIEKCFGNIPTKEKKQDYYPPAEWILIDKLKNKKPNHLIPDTIMRKEENSDIYLLDAKYYNFESYNNLPAASDINKQITYGNYAKDNGKINSTNNDVYNAFLIPYNFKKDFQQLETKNNLERDDNNNLTNDMKDPFFYIGYSSLVDERNNKEEKQKHEKVLGILVDTKWLLEKAIKNSKQKNIQSLSEFIEKTYKKEVANGKTWNW